MRLNKTKCMWSRFFALCFVIFILMMFVFDTEKKFSSPLYSKRETWQIQIVTVLTRDSRLEDYKTALESIKCYSAIHNYDYRLVYDDQYKVCQQKDLFFRRHCVVAELLQRADYTLFIEADIGVVNPSRKIEDYIDPKFDLVFYDRFYDQEIMAGSYIAKNSDRANTILRDFADFEDHLPNSFTGTDNGAIHLFLARLLFPRFYIEINECTAVYNVSKDYDDLFAYIACIKTLFGAAEDFGYIKVFQKGTGWARDGWLTNGKFSQKRDFMLHGWKTKSLMTYAEQELPLSPISGGNSGWYFPFAGNLSSLTCLPGTTTWSYDMNLISSDKEISERLTTFHREVEKIRWNDLARFAKQMNYTN